ncbi:MAG: M15 family metallopeptidase [Nocardioidaceae bacterium]
MVDAGMVRPECPVRRPGQLRVVAVNYRDFDGGVSRGRLVVRRDVARSVARIFTRIFESGFRIRQMRPIDEFGGDDAASQAADNTSAFNCRQPDQNNSPYAESPHANGRAIDINPRENPWRDFRCDCWEPLARHAERTRGLGKILSGGAVWRAFVSEGWIWQDIDVPDYMHFDTGYPSVPWRPGRR